MQVEGSAGVLGAQGHAGLSRVLARRHRTYVDTDEFDDLIGKGGAGSGAHLLGDREHGLEVQDRCPFALAHRFKCRQQCACAGLVVEMPGADEAGLRYFRIGIKGNEISTAKSEPVEFVLVAAMRVQPQLNLIPGNGQAVDLLVEGMTGSQQRQYLAPEGAVSCKYSNAPAFGESA